MRVLLGTGHAGGNIPPLLDIVERLARRGHTVRVLLGHTVPERLVPETLPRRFTAAGCEVIVPDASVWLEGAAELPAVTDIPAHFPRILGFTRFASVAAPWAIQTVRAIEEFKPDVVLGDFHAPGGAIGAEAAGVPVVGIAPTVAGRA